MSSLLIAGAKGFAKELLEVVVQLNPAREYLFFDNVSNDLAGKLFERFPIVRSFEEAEDHFVRNGPAFALGVGSPLVRKEFFERFTLIGGVAETIISVHARVGEFGNQVGAGTCALADVVIESSNEIGRGVLLHVGALVSHDVKIGEFCEISPRANLLGGVVVGDRSRIGTNSTILPGVSIGNDAIVGAGAVVTRDVHDGERVVGVPARSI